MSESLLARYLDPAALMRIASRRIEPRGPVEGSLAGGHRSPLSGFAVEFAGHREYVPGDDPKHIDWRATFARDRCVVKQYAMETNFVCHLALDASASMRYGEGAEQKLLYAARALAALAFAIIRQGDTASLAVFDERLRDFVPPSSSVRQLTRIAERLDAIGDAAAGGFDFDGLFAQLGRREIVFLFSDFLVDLEALETRLQRLRYLRHEVALLQFLHHDELSFEFGGLVKFVGLEEPGAALTWPRDLRRRYLEALSAHQERLGAICRRLEAEHVLIDTRRDLGEALLDYLRQRRRLSRG
jgi:uncharacterized protein (DUF58 family)